MTIKGCVGKALKSAFALAALLGLILSSSSARAMCGDPTGRRFKDPVKIPMPYYNFDNYSGRDGEAPIVGLWHVVYTAGGATFNESFDEWHADGTEFENANEPPTSGNICFGVYKTVAPRTVKLHHIGWMFKPDGTVAGTFTLDELNTVTRDGRQYNGTFTFKTFATDGTLGANVSGTMVGSRITVD